MRNYWQLLRVPYQLQLGPIFGWGYLMAGGRLHEAGEVLRFLLVFGCFHLGCFGGLTALNSFYDRDAAPIGGLWNPPSPPRLLWHFAWLVQIAGVLPLLCIDLKLAALYSAIVALALGYSHPRTRWKGRPFHSLAVVALGQGVLDFCAGAFTVTPPHWNSATWLALTGATLYVMALYPLTQLFQMEDDAQRGDRTLAVWLWAQHGQRAPIFWFCAVWLLGGAAFNSSALLQHDRWQDAVLLLLGAVGALTFLRDWQQNGSATKRDDFRRAHLLLRWNAVAFSAYLLARLVL
jgi:1,4-dihydroxy-2-naphthoate octaprenyltransferase